MEKKMPSSDNVGLSVSIDAGNSIDVLNKINDNIIKLQGTTTETAKKMADSTSQVDKGFDQLKNTLGSIISLGLIKKVFGDAYAEATDAAKAQIVLENNLKNVGLQYKDIEKSVTRIAKINIVDDDDVKKIYTFATGMGVGKDKLNEFVEVAYDFAASKSVDVRSALRFISADAIKGGADWDALKNRVKGAGESMATAAGAMKVIDVQNKQMSENFGFFLKGILEPLLYGWAKFMQVLIDIPKPIQSVAFSIGIATAAFVGLKSILGLLPPAFTMAGTAAGVLSASLGWISLIVGAYALISSYMTNIKKEMEAARGFTANKEGGQVVTDTDKYKKSIEIEQAYIDNKKRNAELEQKIIDSGYKGRAALNDSELKELDAFMKIRNSISSDEIKLLDKQGKERISLMNKNLADKIKIDKDTADAINAGNNKIISSYNSAELLEIKKRNGEIDDKTYIERIKNMINADNSRFDNIYKKAQEGKKLDEVEKKYLEEGLTLREKIKIFETDEAEKTKKINEDKIKNLKELEDFEKGILKDSLTQKNKKVELLNDERNEKLSILKNMEKDELQYLKYSAYINEYYDKLIADEKESNNQKVLSVAQSIYGQMIGVISQYYSNQLAQEGLSLEETKKIKREQWTVEHALATATAFFNIPKIAQDAYSSLIGIPVIGPVVAPAAAIVAGGFATYQAGLVASAPMPAFAKGTNSAPGGMALVGENGPEIINLPRGSKVNTAKESEKMMGAVYNYNFNAPVYDIKNAVKDAMVDIKRSESARGQ
jgi:hypothetical protein